MKKKWKNLVVSKKCSTFAPSNKNKQQFKTITTMLTITQPRELAKAMVEKYYFDGMIDTEEGQILYYYKNNDGEVCFPMSNDTDIDDVINAYGAALVYELEKITGGTWIIR